ncbi:dTDP-4-dehydrorhamnose 3,5-epimerase [uncultured Prochlorococcus sp.]|uniref:dTDP-4-dehydrorhamnose 3,5-epimerase n=1 Tax=uncultured Prochlorococcus sp. TaxID=159733 RepID=UPI00258651E3|nr:dTDP-4-dehydrorhamnose 3,5-epimerase [uncultured Prochlorococcus sp.]
MKVINTSLDEVKIFEPTVFEDERGFFYESFNKNFFQKSISPKIEFVQDNHSKSSKGVLRGLHYQLEPFAQGKLVRVVSGEVFDVAVDIRSSSKNFGKWVGIILSARNKKQFWVPPGFAHGFLTLSDNTEFLYKTTNFYNRESERSIKWNDPDINIDWGMDIEPIISTKDQDAPYLSNADLFC